MRPDTFTAQPHLPREKESGTFVLDFYNEPDDILAAFQPYYQTAELTDVSDPQLVFELFENFAPAAFSCGTKWSNSARRSSPRTNPMLR